MFFAYLTASGIDYKMSRKSTRKENGLGQPALRSNFLQNPREAAHALLLNPQTRAYLRELAKDFNVSTNAVREELNQLTHTQLLRSEKSGRQVYYMANTEHVLFPELRSMVQKVMGIDKVIDGIVYRLGNLQKAYLIDDYAEGKDSGIIDIILVGGIDTFHLNDLTRKTENYINRKIRSLVLTLDEFHGMLPKLMSRPIVLIWDAK